ncbi:MAG: hypothetical protein RMK29_04295 [Myxococcales bacterium]|nr:hypothetical protein [Myxococcales bacterium]
MSASRERSGTLWDRFFCPPAPPAPTGQPPSSEAARLRELAAEKRREQEEAGRQRDLQQRAIDQAWREARERLGPRAIALVKAEVLRRARAAAERGETSISVDLGVNEERLRISSSLKELNLAEAVLKREPGPREAWDYVDRVGWLLQSFDGQGLSAEGESLVSTLQEQGFSILFLPYFVQDHHAEPFVNARLEIQW